METEVVSPPIASARICGRFVRRPRRQILRALQNEYVTVPDRPAAFGDVILFRDAKAESVHMCVYIADDIVFTKNGAHYFQPWVLMRFADVVARYPSANASRTSLFRKNALE